MNEQIKSLLDNIKLLQSELEAELAKQRADLHYGLERGRIVFEAEIRRRHMELQTRLIPYIRSARPMVALTAPVIYAMIVPFVFLDLAVSLYQFICFPAYGIEKVRRKDYMVFDRQYLAYLNPLEKLNCAYCSYGNGVVAYAREIAGRTEARWCPIKHARIAVGTHDHYRDFLDYGDAQAYKDMQSERDKKTHDPA